ncbi:hypothetical protein [Dyella ginsengisoli]|uniref:hypothetical protein n=1 Tax=Dyella ginsengisoli TaxID=363848 RepID=UPI0003490C50|nr:hypothetical protein [Dyella ginsengisoli]
MKSIANMIVAGAQRASCAVSSAQHRLERAVTGTPELKATYKAVYGLTAALVLFAPMAHAQQSLGDSMNTAGQTVDAGKTLAGKIGIALAAVFMVSAGLMMRRRSNEGDQSQITWGKIGGAVIAAIICGAGGALLLRAGASVGLQSSDYGTLPGS